MTGDIDDERFRLTVTVPDEEAVLELADAVDEVNDVRIVEGESTTRWLPGSSIRVDVGTLTPKQWEALELAFEEGYYDQPRSVDLESLANDLSISKSAVSQRLRSAEATIVEGVLDGVRAQVRE